MTFVWRERSRLYLIGVAGLVIATLAYSVGHVAPFWLKQDGEQINIGLWFQCQDGNCVSHSFGGDQDSVKAASILQVLGLLGLVTAVAFAIFANCRRHHPGHSFFLEMVIALGAVLGFSGSMVYLSVTREDVENSRSTQYDWAFALSIAASLLALLSAVLIFIDNVLNFRHATKHGNSSTQNAGLVDHKQRTSDETPSFDEPPQDYSPDPAVYCKQGPDSYLPLSDLHFAPDRVHGRRAGAEADGFPGRGWQKITMNLPSSRRVYEEQSHLGVRMQRGGVERPVQHPVSTVPGGVFMMPRVVIRGFYEPGYGYPEYTMM